MARNVSSAAPAKKLVVRVATVYWLADENKTDEGLPKTRMISSNVCPPSKTNATVMRVGATTLEPIAVPVVKKTRDFAHSRVLGELEISLDPFLGSLDANDPGGTFLLELEPPANALSTAPAGPHTGNNKQNRPGNCGSKDKGHDGLFRVVRMRFDLEFDANRLPIVSNLEDADPEAIPRGPHWLAVVHPKPLKAGADQCILMDWKPDWLRRVEPARRPILNSRNGSDVEMIVLHNISGGSSESRRFPNAAAAITTFMLKLVAKKDDDGNKVLDPVTGEVVKVDQQSGIHYVVDVDGHVTKMAHETFNTRHGGGSSPRNWGNLKKTGINNGAVGIEHALLKNNPEFYPALVDASVDLVRQIATHFPTFRPWNLVGHSHVVNKKLCPGVNFPWNRYESEIIGHAGLPARSIPMAIGADELHFPNTQAIYDGFFAVHPDAAIGAENDGVNDSKAAIKELQRDLREIGFRHAKVTGTYDQGTRRAVREFHSRFMNGSHIVPQDFQRPSQNTVNLESATQIKRVISTLEFLKSVEFPLAAV